MPTVASLSASKFHFANAADFRDCFSPTYIAFLCSNSWLEAIFERLDSRTKGENNRNRARRWGERGNDTAKCSVLKNVATGVDAIPSLNCLSWSIEVHGRNQAPFYPVHSRQRERWMDGAPRRRWWYILLWQFNRVPRKIDPIIRLLSS